MQEVALDEIPLFSKEPCATIQKWDGWKRERTFGRGRNIAEWQMMREPGTGPGKYWENSRPN